MYMYIYIYSSIYVIYAYHIFNISVFLNYVIDFSVFAFAFLDCHFLLLSIIQKNMSRVIYWFRSDLRLHDSPALIRSLELQPEYFFPVRVMITFIKL